MIDVYGNQNPEIFGFRKESFTISNMTFCEKSQYDLLFLPDFLGYIFRKSKEFEIMKNEKNKLQKNGNDNFTKINSSGNFHPLYLNENLIERIIDDLK